MITRSQSPWRNLPEIVSAVALVLMLAGCAEQGFPPNRPTQVAKYQPETVAGWPFEGLAEVRAYRMNWNAPGHEPGNEDLDLLVLKDGTLNSTRLPKEGVPLTDAEVVILRDAVCGTHPEHVIASCFFPHHAFLFLNEEGEVLGSLDVCFMCAKIRGEPSGFAEYWDVASIRDLVVDLGMPISVPGW